jgi:hypothetical protein
VSLFAVAAAGQFVLDAVWITNACVLAQIAVALVPGSLFGEPAGAPAPFEFLGRCPRWAARVLPPLTALLVALPTLGLPFLSDDYETLATRGIASSFWAALTADEGSVFYRPAGWGLWWIVGQVDTGDAGFARGLCAALFAVDAALVVPALRRCGASRSLSMAAAILFAVHPLVFETLGWLSNFYSFLALGFSLGAVAALPYRRPRWARMLLTAVLAALACLSKEDAFFIPVLLTAAGARFRLRGILTWAWRTAPATAAVAGVFALRTWQLQGLGGYSHQGTSLMRARIFWGPHYAFLTELPAGYALPLRAGALGVKEWTRDCANLVLPLLLAVGGATRVASRGLTIATVLFAVTAAPTAPLLPVKPDLASARFLFSPSLAVALAAASLCAGAAWSPRARWATIAAYALASVLAVRVNFDAWSRTGAIVRQARSSAESRFAGLPESARVWVIGLPDAVNGVQCFHNAEEFCFRRWLRRPGLRVADAYGPNALLDALFVFDLRTAEMRALPAEEGYALTPSGDSLELDFTSSGSDRGRVRTVELQGIDGRQGEWVLLATSARSRLLIPSVKAPQSAQIRLFVDGFLETGPEEREEMSQAVVSQRTASGIDRRIYSLDAPIPTAGGPFSIELAVPNGARFRVRSLRFAAQ